MEIRVPEPAAFINHIHITEGPPKRSKVPQITARRKALLDENKNTPQRVIPIAPNRNSPVYQTAVAQAFETTNMRFTNVINVEEDMALRTKLYREEKAVRLIEEDLNRGRLRASEASQSIIDYVMATRDPMVPSVHGRMSETDKELIGGSAGCCTIL